MTFSEGTAPAVVVIGAVNVDAVVAAPALPRPGETVVGADVAYHGGGKGANAAVAGARVGARCSLVGAVGADTFGDRSLAELRAEGVDVSAVSVLQGRPTGVALIVVDPAGDNQIAVAQGANAAVPADVASQAVKSAPRGSCVVISTEIAPAAVVAAVETAAGAGVRCILNPAPVIDEVLAVVDLGAVFTPNAGECLTLARAAGWEGSGSAPADAAIPLAAQYLSRLSGAPVVVTRGTAGALVARQAEDVDRLPAPAVEAVDTTGAGDTFNGVLAAGLAGGSDLLDAVRVAVRAASLSVTKAGARAGMPGRHALFDR